MHAVHMWQVHTDDSEVSNRLWEKLMVAKREEANKKGQDLPFLSR